MSERYGGLPSSIGGPPSKRQKENLFHETTSLERSINMSHGVGIGLKAQLKTNTSVEFGSKTTSRRSNNPLRSLD
jgi:hypothetical protein